MKYSAALLTAALGVVNAAVNDAGCSGASTDEGGNYFCSLAEQILYTGLSGSGSYQDVTFMDSSGACTFAPRSYTGSLSPFDEELSVHIRGPAVLNQFAVYKLNGASKRDVNEEHVKRHNHGHRHQRRKSIQERREELQEREVWVTATIDGQVVSWINNYNPGAAATTPAAAPAPAVVTTPAAAPVAPAATTPAAAPAAASPVASPASSPQSKTNIAAPGNYERVSYFKNDGTAQNVTFLGNYGGQGSGVFDNAFGNSLSFINAGSTGGAASSTVSSGNVPDGKEFSIWSDIPCTTNPDGCGYYRPGSVAMHGWDGADKIFMFEFSMPDSGSQAAGSNMPAIWLLNSKIPRCAQYNACSCWGGIGQSGCGEADLFEVLAPGDTKMKSTFHFARSIGASNYFNRPTSGTIKAAAIFMSSSSQVAIQILPDSTDFSATLDASQVTQWLGGTGISGLLSEIAFPS